MFIENVLTLYGLLHIITSDKRFQFINDFWKRFYKILKMDRRLSTAYYPQIDRLAEKINSIIETYLRTFIN